MNKYFEVTVEVVVATLKNAELLELLNNDKT